MVFNLNLFFKILGIAGPLFTLLSLCLLAWA
jgi:hypothetical protein